MSVTKKFKFVACPILILEDVESFITEDFLKFSITEELLVFFLHNILDLSYYCLHAAMGIYDTMKLCEADVSTICMGLAASMAAFILATGTKGKRFCMPNSRVMIHRPEGYAAEEEEVSTWFLFVVRLLSLKSKLLP